MTDRLKEVHGAMQTLFNPVVPQSLRLPTVIMGTPCIRDEVKIQPQQQSYQRSKNQYITIRIPNTDLWDLRRSYLTFDLTVTSVGGSYVRLAQGAWSLINRARLLFQRNEVEDVFQYGRRESFFYEFIHNYNIKATHQKLMGLGSAAQREANAATSTSYMIPLNLASLHASVWPCMALENYMEIELYLQDVNECFESDASSIDYTITNIDLHAERLTITNSLERKYKEMIRAGRFIFKIETTRHYLNNLTTREGDLKIPHSTDSVKWIASWFVKESEQNDPTVDDKYFNWYKEGQINYQARVNQRRYPEHEVDTSDIDSIEAYMWYSKWSELNAWSGDGHGNKFIPVGVQHFTADNRYVWINDFTSHPGSGAINPFGTGKSNVDIILNTKHVGIPSEPLQVHHYVCYTAVLKIVPPTGNHMYGVVKRLE